ncbi:MAG: acyltransferase family protein [Chromatocurvus sp.]
MIAYRPEIDGLRAVAVIPIVLFHAGVDQLSGGYIGVDIFFVISGYLIGSIILGDLSRGRFSFRSFYLRRMRRILPALLFTVAATLASGYFVLLPEEWMDLARSAVAALFFIPNINFWMASSTYFGLDVATQPLLHTWSLGVEEQFYLLAPALIVGFYRRYRDVALPLMLLVLCFISFQVNLYWMELDSKFAFYMLPARAWELLTGVLLAWWLPSHVPHRRSGAALSAVGLALCVLPVFLLDEHSPFPGVNALYPVLGSAMIILGTAAAPVGHVARLLATWPFLAVGRISYSLYLVHWPVVVYMGLLRPGESSPLLVLVISVCLATASYRFVEERYRRPPPAGVATPGRRRRELQGLLASCLVACSVIVIAEGFSWRVPDAAWSVAGSTAAGEDYGHCEVLADDPSLEAVRCRLGSAEAPVSVALWGDSHANALAPALDTALHQLGQGGYLYFGSGCRPLLGVARPGRSRCPRFNAEVVSAIAADAGLETVYLAGYWRLPLMGQSYDKGNFLVQDELSTERSPAENRAVFQRGLERTLAALPMKQVILVEDIPEVGSQFGKSVGNHFVREQWLTLKRRSDYSFVARDDDVYADRLDALLATAFPALAVLRLQETLCEDARCPLVQEGKLAYYDGDHLSEAGSLMLAPVFAQDLKRRAAVIAGDV